MNTSPPAVTSGPPAPGVPSSHSHGTCASLSMLPSGTSQRMVLLTRSTAVSAAQGGAVHGVPSGDSSGSILATYGVPSVGNSIGLPVSIAWFLSSVTVARGSSEISSGTRLDGTIITFDFGSQAPPPQSGPPAAPGISTVPFSLGG